jgi:glycosyltransferase involved in cell wall biosynthesis
MIAFTVVIPSLNQAYFIQKTIDSVLDQNYPYKQIIVIDGGSTDETIQILESYSEEILAISEPDEGQSQAINKGFQLSTSSHVSWLNSDDILYPGALERVANFFARHPDTKILYGNCEYIDTADRVLKKYPAQPYSYKDLVENAHNYIPQPATFFAREILSTVGSINEQLHFVMDFEYWLRSGKVFNLVHIPETLAALRVHPDAKSKKDLFNFARELELVYKQIILPDQELGEIDKTKAMANMYYRAAHSAYWSPHHRSALQFAFKGLQLEQYLPRRLFFQCLLARVGFHMKAFVNNPYEIPENPEAIPVDRNRAS